MFYFQILPEDAHIRVSGKVHISLTRVYDRQNVIVSQFDSREELIEVSPSVVNGTVVGWKQFTSSNSNCLAWLWLLHEDLHL